MKINQAKYSDGFGKSNFIYFSGNPETANFYENWIDCKEKNDKYIRGFVADKIREALINFYKKNTQNEK